MHVPIIHALVSLFIHSLKGWLLSHRWLLDARRYSYQVFILVGKERLRIREVARDKNTISLQMKPHCC